MDLWITIKLIIIVLKKPPVANISNRMSFYLKIDISESLIAKTWTRTHKIEDFCQKKKIVNHISPFEFIDDSVPQPKDKLEGESSGLYSKIIFFVLISILGLAVGVIVFQLGPLKDQEKVETIADIPESQPEVQLDVIEVQEASYPQPVISGITNNY